MLFFKSLGSFDSFATLSTNLWFLVWRQYWWKPSWYIIILSYRCPKLSFLFRYLIASHLTDYKQPMFFLNTVAVFVLVVAKLPNMHKVRIFGINADIWVPLEEVSGCSRAPRSERGTWNKWMLCKGNSVAACNICVGVERTVNVTLAYCTRFACRLLCVCCCSFFLQSWFAGSCLLVQHSSMWIRKCIANAVCRLV